MALWDELVVSNDGRELAVGSAVKESVVGSAVKESAVGSAVKESAVGLAVKESAVGSAVKESTGSVVKESGVHSAVRWVLSMGGLNSDKSAWKWCVGWSQLTHSQAISVLFWTASRYCFLVIPEGTRK